MSKKTKKKSSKGRQHEKQIRQQRERKAERRPRQWPKGKLLVGVCLVALIFVAYSAWQYLIQLPPTIGGETNDPLPTSSAPIFSLRDINGTDFSLDKFSGRVIAIHFMAVGCGGQIRPINDHQLKQLKAVCNDSCGNKPVTAVSVAVATCANSDLARIRINYDIAWILGNDYADGKMDIVEAYKLYLIKDGTILLIDKAFNVDKIYAEATTSETLSSRINQLLEI